MNANSSFSLGALLTGIVLSAVARCGSGKLLMLLLQCIAITALLQHYACWRHAVALDINAEQS
jgi:hypothetical protein